MSFSEEKEDFKNLLSTYTKNWKWFVISTFSALILAFIYIRYATPEFAVKSQIQIVEDKNSPNELSVFQDLDVFGGSSKQVEDEIEILSSRANFIEVVKELGINIKIFAQGNVINSEVYINPPFNINFIASDSVVNNAEFEFFIDIASTTTFQYSEIEGEMPMAYSFGNAVKTSIGDMIITPNKDTRTILNRAYQVKIRPIEYVAIDLKSLVIITPAEEFSNIMDISLTGPIIQKSKDILNKLIEVYNRNAVEEKRRIADTTSEFINNRIQLISGTLSNVDEDAQELLTEKGMTGSGLEVGAAVQVSAGSRQNLENAKVQLQMVSGLKDYITSESNYEELPVVEVGSSGLNQATAQYNQLISERKRLLRSADEQNPMIVNLDEQLDGLKNTIQSSLASLEQNAGMNVNTLQNQLGRIQGTIYAAPENQRELRNITRKQETTESLYLYLLQKREESQIAFASAAPKSNIIDSAYAVSPIPVKPKKIIVYLAAFILGLLLPFGIIYGHEQVNTKIRNKSNIESLTKDVPVLGELPKLSKKDGKLITIDDRSVLAEALRIIRTNLDFLIKTRRDSTNNKNNIVLVTSSTPGEGKTFVSTNLSMILASTNKKVLLVGADIRNPKLYTFFSGDAIDKLKTPTRNKDAGFTEYLLNNSLNLQDVIRPMLVHNNTVDVIYSGKIPPNPSELLMSPRVEELLKEVSQLYDYVIVDTAPLMVVSDTLLLTPLVNHIIYVTRAGVTEEAALKFPINLMDEGKLKGISFIVNDVALEDLGYGGKYGYGYAKTSKKWWKF